MRPLKRAFDIVAVVVSLPIVAPLFALVATVILVLDGRPVLFRQERAGLRGRPFHIFKFRTMTNVVDAAGKPLGDHARTTRIGAFLRKTSLDEIPQLLNVLRGELSLVGPRPLYVRYIPRYNSEQARRLHAVPGITGWAQVNGRNALSWSEKFELDVWYIDHQSMVLDLKILLRTVRVAILGSGVNQSTGVTMHEFMGNHERQEQGDNNERP